MKVSAKGKKMLRSSEMEGEKLTAYLDSAEVWTIGAGHTERVDGVRIHEGMKITAQKSEELLSADLAKFESAVSRYVKVPMAQYQFDALVMFAFNIGVGGFLSTSALKLLNAGSSPESVTKAMALWKYETRGGKKVESRGLINRRRKEANLFLRGEYVGTS